MAAGQSRNQRRAMAVPAMLEHGRDARGTSRLLPRRVSQVGRHLPAKQTPSVRFRAAPP